MGKIQPDNIQAKLLQIEGQFAYAYARARLSLGDKQGAICDQRNAELMSQYARCFVGVTDGDIQHADVAGGCQ